MIPPLFQPQNECQPYWSGRVIDGHPRFADGQFKLTSPKLRTILDRAVSFWPAAKRSPRRRSWPFYKRSGEWSSEYCFANTAKSSPFRARASNSTASFSASARVRVTAGSVRALPLKLIRICGPSPGPVLRRAFRGREIISHLESDRGRRDRTKPAALRLVFLIMKSPPGQALLSRILYNPWKIHNAGEPGSADPRPSHSRMRS